MAKATRRGPKKGAPRKTRTPREPKSTTVAQLDNQNLRFSLFSCIFYKGSSIDEALVNVEKAYRYITGAGENGMLKKPELKDFQEGPCAPLAADEIIIDYLPEFNHPKEAPKKHFDTERLTM